MRKRIVVLAVLIGPGMITRLTVIFIRYFLTTVFVLVMLVVEPVKGSDMLYNLLIFVIVYACHPRVYDRAERCANKVKIY